MAELQVAAMPIFDKNRFVDDILNVVFEHCKERRLLFSSFEPDICTLLSLKQPRFPVFFLTSILLGMECFMDFMCTITMLKIH
mmetsp:Transcript_28889/g.74130  ORF Transcript_28889/g.74130 Transcript_28889/m.74130 type:complete len:83 (-) Transcript_28889:469-717(-)